MLKCTPDYFEGQVYSRTDSYDMDEMCFSDSNVVTRFDFGVATQLILARKLKNILIVDSSEIEEIIIPSIEDC